MRRFFRQLTAALLLTMAMVACETNDTELDDGEAGGTSGSGSTGDSTWVDPDGVIEWIDEMLCERYLYNEEYAALEDRDFDKTFDEFFEDNLKSLKGINVLDYKLLNEAYIDKDDEETWWSLFSYVEGTSPDGETRSSFDEATDFGFITMTTIYLDDKTLGFYVLAVYNDSPADKAGIRRGMVITSVNGESLTIGNYESLFYALIYPTAGQSLTLGLYTSGEGVSSKSITTATYDMNPVLRCEVIDETNKVGYLNYVLFNPTYDDKLLEGFQLLSEEGVAELILDLRYNIGGYVSSASIMTNAITSTPSGSSQVFQYYRLNDSLTEDYTTTKGWTGLKFDSTHSMFYETLSGINSDYHLTELGTTVYCLVSYNTASASEMVINALRGMGYTVVLIGETTRGKNVGMYIFDKSFEDYDYELAPISFENFNCLREGGYEDGMEPTYEVTTLETLMGFYDFSADEPLVSKALSLITGSSQKRSITTRSTETEQLSLSQSQIPMPTPAIHGALKRTK